MIVIGDLLEHVREPGRLLESLYDLATPGAQIVCCLPNMAHLSVIERMVAGDISYDTMGLLDATHVRFYSPASAFRPSSTPAGCRICGPVPRRSAQTHFAAKIVEGGATPRRAGRDRAAQPRLLPDDHRLPQVGDGGAARAGAPARRSA